MEAVLKLFKPPVIRVPKHDDASRKLAAAAYELP